MTAALSVIGKVQTGKRLAGNQQVWNYLAPAEVIVHSINYPAAVGACFTTGNHGLWIGLEYSGTTFAVYVIGIVLLWYIVGRSIDGRQRTIKRRLHVGILLQIDH